MTTTILMSSNTQMPHAVLNLYFVPEYMCPAALTLFPLSSELFVRFLRISVSELSAVLKQDRTAFARGCSWPAMDAKCGCYGF